MQFTPPGVKILGLSPHILFTNIPFITTWYSPASQEFYILPFCFQILSISQTNALLGKGRDFYMAWSQRTGVDTQGSETNQWLSRYSRPSDSTAFCIFALSLCLWLQVCLDTWRRKQNKEKKMLRQENVISGRKMIERVSSDLIFLEVTQHLELCSTSSCGARDQFWCCFLQLCPFLNPKKKQRNKSRVIVWTLYS